MRRLHGSKLAIEIARSIMTPSSDRFPMVARIALMSGGHGEGPELCGRCVQDVVNRIAEVLDAHGIFERGKR